ncbi:hypothetical protein KC19_3G039300 [Ceratodon purpureus]|uniref:Secreted protein n=1 Tax=Ceratodon purpureus TaxID=3225 RepID=A0A8T0IEK9_CERPU|nr:hypothetical protein KC19_3G039300 [Ceratodon purpureus]
MHHQQPVREWVALLFLCKQAVSRATCSAKLSSPQRRFEQHSKFHDIVKNNTSCSFPFAEWSEY